jgi:hypothetical protein
VCVCVCVCVPFHSGSVNCVGGHLKNLFVVHSMLCTFLINHEMIGILVSCALTDCSEVAEQSFVVQVWSSMHDMYDSILQSTRDDFVFRSVVVYRCIMYIWSTRVMHR